MASEICSQHLSPRGGGEGEGSGPARGGGGGKAAPGQPPTQVHLLHPLLLQTLGVEDTATSQKSFWELSEGFTSLILYLDGRGELQEKGHPPNDPKISSLRDCCLSPDVLTVVTAREDTVHTG